jgi:hypothetical protein
MLNFEVFSMEFVAQWYGGNLSPKMRRESQTIEAESYEMGYRLCSET